MNQREILHLQNVSRAGIMGGTFDPIHQGHLVTAEAARSEFKLDKVIFVPSGQPPHKRGLPITQKENRYIMSVLATAANPYFEVSRTEIDRPGESYAYETVRYFKGIMQEQSELFFITGADAIQEILTWKNVGSLLEMCTFIAATRPGYSLHELKEKLISNILPIYAHKIIPLEVPAMAISSTDIRQRVKMKSTIKYLLPEAVENFIQKNDLYQN